LPIASGDWSTARTLMLAGVKVDFGLDRRFCCGILPD
jgi:hypothetical protein